MTIHSIRIHQFKLHEDSQFDFTGKLSAITGDNAKGKSTLLKAIMFALRGPSAVGDKGRIPTRGGDGDTKVELKITLPVHGPVTVSRTLRNCKISAEDGTLLANGVTPSLKLIEEAYGMQAADLDTLLYARQGESQALLELGATALQKTVERLAKATVLDNVLTLLGKDVAELEGELRALGEKVDTTHLCEHLHNQQQELAYLIGTRHNLVAAARRWQDELKACDAAMAEQLELAATARRLEEELTKARTQSQSWEGELQALAIHQYPPDLAERRNRAEALRQSLQQRVADLNADVKLAAALDRNLRSAAWLVTDTQQRLAQAEALAPRLKDAAEALERQQAEYMRCKGIADAASRTWEEAQQSVLNGVCRECKRPFSEVEQAAAVAREAEAREALALAEQAITTLYAPLRVAEEHLRDLQLACPEVSVDQLLKAQADADKAGADLQALLTRNKVQDVAQLEQQWQVSREELTTVANDADSLSNMLRNYDKDVVRADLAKRMLLSLGNQIEQLQAEIGNLPAIDTDAAMARLTSAKRQEQVASAALIGADRRQEVVENTLSHLTAELDRIEQIERRRATAVEPKSRAERLHTWLRKSRGELMSDLWENMLAYASHLISQTTEGRLSRVFRHEGELMVEENGEIEAVSELSGFQRSLLGLALRIAMSRTFFGQEHPLLLDEPTADARDDNAARVAGMLQALGSQVIFVTHREGDAANAGTIIHL